jgi:hypothetical protein
MFHVSSDGSVVDARGKIIFFSLERFISDIANGDCCFICGAQRNAVQFNDEHVISDWILRRFGLHSRHIEIPNRTGFRYGELSVPCCVMCNAEMGRQFEQPMSRLFTDGFDAVSQELNYHGPWHLFSWMALIFLKAHLKDKYLNYHRDRRKGDMKIAELHSWEELHHLHCVIRAFCSGAALDKEVLGSFLVLPAKVRPHFEGFDFIDLSVAQTMLLAIADVAIIAVFNDSQAGMSIAFESLQQKIGGPCRRYSFERLRPPLQPLTYNFSPDRDSSLKSTPWQRHTK